jgi:WD40-like Beta Propeller Repeat
MRTSVRSLPALLGVLATAALSADVSDKKVRRFSAKLYFPWEEANDPQISPDGTRIVYVRRWPDVVTDRRFSNLWTVNFSGSDNRPLTTGEYSDSSPRWPDGKRLAFISNRDGDSQIFAGWTRDRLRGLRISATRPPTLAVRPMEPALHSPRWFHPNGPSHPKCRRSPEGQSGPTRRSSLTGSSTGPKREKNADKINT